MAEPARIEACANQDCKAPFHSLGEGKLSVFAIHNPLLWGLPANVKQKALWLCGRCCQHMSVRLDPGLHQVRLIPKQVQPVPKQAQPRQAAKVA